MKRVAVVLAIATIPLLAGCHSLVEAAQERCRATYPAGSPAYEQCWHREYDRQMQILNEDANRRARGEFRKGY